MQMVPVDTEKCWQLEAEYGDSRYAENGYVLASC